MDNETKTAPTVGAIEPIPIYEQTPILDMLPTEVKNALQGIGGLLDDPMIAMPGGFARMPLKRLMQELAERQAIFAQQVAKHKRAKQVYESAVRDGYAPDIDNSVRIMNNTEKYGKSLKKEMNELKKLIDNYGNTQ